MITVELGVDRPVEEVFDYMVDFRNENEWNPVARDLEMLSQGSVGQGSRFRGDYRRMGAMEYEITTYERPRRFEVKGHAKNFDWNSTFVLTPSTGGTHLVGTMDPHPAGMMRLMKPFMEPMIRGQMKAGMASFKKTLESKPAKGAPESR